jgi:chromate transporter
LALVNLRLLLFASFAHGVLQFLGAALYNPVWTSAVKTPGDFGLALVGFVLLTVWQAPPLAVVAISALGGIGLALTGSA